MIPEAMLECYTHHGGHIAQMTRACLISPNDQSMFKTNEKREFCEVLGLTEEPPEVQTLGLREAGIYSLLIVGACRQQCQEQKFQMDQAEVQMENVPHSQGPR